MTTTGNWATDLNVTAVGDFIASMAPASAAARLCVAAPQVNLAGKKSVLVPRRLGGAKPSGDYTFTAEGDAIPVRQGQLDAAELGPLAVLAGIFAASNKLLDYTNAEAVFGQMLREDLGSSFDAALFSATAASPAQPAGILADVSPIEPDASTAAFDQMVADLGNLSGEIAFAGGSGENIVYIASPGQYAFWSSRRSLCAVTMWPSAALSDGDVVAIQTDAFVSATGGDIEISRSDQTTVHMANPASPLVDGPPPAAPIYSLFQMGLTGIKVRLTVAWALRGPLVSMVSGVNWGRAPSSRVLRPLTKQLIASRNPSTVQVQRAPE